MKIIKKILLLIIIVSVSITIGCQSKEINMSDNENSKALEFIKEVVDNQVNKEKMGNSVQNILNGGLVAYDEENIYYNEINIPNEGNYIYKKNIKTNEINEVSKVEDRDLLYINIYDDYVYYVSSTGWLNPVDQIIRVKKDGSEKKVIVAKEENMTHTTVQIIGDFLYYAVNIGGDNESATKMDFMKINLKTLEKNKIITINRGDIISISNKGIIETYLRENGYFSLTKKIVSKEEEGFTPNVLDILDKEIEYIIGVDTDYIYYVKDDVIEKRSLENFDEKISLVPLKKEIYIDSYIIGKNNIYYACIGGDLVESDINTKEVETIKGIDIRHTAAAYDKFAFKIFEVKGDLVYYNHNAKLVVDKDINILNDESKSYNYDEFDIFTPNRQLTEEEAIRLAYYRVCGRLSDDNSMTEFDGRKCLNLKYILKANEFGDIYVDLNSGEVYLDSDPGWKKYINKKEDIEIGSSYGWE